MQLIFRFSQFFQSIVLCKMILFCPFDSFFIYNYLLSIIQLITERFVNIYTLVYDTRANMLNSHILFTLYQCMKNGANVFCDSYWKSEWDTRGFRGTDSRINQENRSESVRSVRSNSEKLLLYLWCMRKLIRAKASSCWDYSRLCVS